MNYLLCFLVGLILGTAALSTAQWHDYQEEYRQQQQRNEALRQQQYNQSILNQFLMQQQRHPC